ncbi:MAG: tetratricopeptide repeat-containing sensor histidine kinase [Cyclobacteriaceae bacterium]|nr:tetratricopeptide repeat-containing sensor histidine kinase [Cyclobacteriaceae bacterium]
MFIVLSCLILPHVAAFGQEAKIDSLKKELANVHDTSRFNVLWGLAYELFDVDNLKALDYARSSNAYAKKEGDSLRIVKSGRIAGQLYRRVDQLDKSIEILTETLPISKRNFFDKETKLILNSLALGYTFKAEYDKALEYHFQSLIMREADGDKKQISISLNNIGLVYYKLGNFELALDYYLQSLKLKEETKDTFDIIELYLNIGLCYNWLVDYKLAQEYFHKAFKMCSTDCDTKIVIIGKFGLGTSFLGLKNFEEAKKYFEESLHLSTKEGNQRFQVESLVELTRVHLAIDELAIAFVYLNQLDALDEVTPYKESLLSVYELSADYYTRAGNFEKANFFQRKYSGLKDSIYAVSVIKNLNKVQTQFAQRENLAIIAAKDQNLALNEEVILQQRLLNWLLAAVILLTAVLGVVIYLNFRKIQSVNHALASAKTVIEDQNHLLDHQVQTKTKELVHTNEALVKVNDELDNFIYKTSHDIRGPLASLKGMVNLAIMDVKDEKALAYLGKLDLTAEKLNTVLTRLLIVNRINHAELKPEEIHFEPIIQDILTLQMKKGVAPKINIEYEVASDVRLVSDAEMVRLILENLIDNAVKFYNESDHVKSFVKIYVREEGGKVVAHVMDNGTGIVQTSRENIFHMFVRISERSETGGIGLYLAKLATEKLGGDITLNESHEHHTDFVVIFPHDLEKIIEQRKEEQRQLEKEKMWMEGKGGAVQSA